MSREPSPTPPPRAGPQGEVALASRSETPPTLVPTVSDDQAPSVASQQPARADGAAPLHIPGYEPAEEIARGGMGAVYRLFDPELRRDVPVRVRPPESRGAPASRQRF